MNHAHQQAHSHDGYVSGFASRVRRMILNRFWFYGICQLKVGRASRTGLVSGLLVTGWCFPVFCCDVGRLELRVVPLISHWCTFNASWILLKLKYLQHFSGQKTFISNKFLIGKCFVGTFWGKLDLQGSHTNSKRSCRPHFLKFHAAQVSFHSLFWC